MKHTNNAVGKLLECGQSLWLDMISREMLVTGELRRLVRDIGIRGVTSNPDIFLKAVTSSSHYDAEIESLARDGASSLEIYERIAVKDVQKAADLLRAVWEHSQGADGYVSLEVSPHLAHDAVATIDEAERLWRAVARPNVMIKVPATPAGIVAIEELIARGIHVNVTLLFSRDVYRQVMTAYVAGLNRRAKRGEPLQTVHSVASFFVSRIDTLADRLLALRISNLPATPEAPTVRALFGKAAVAWARLAYADFREFFRAPQFRKLAAKGANVQRLLWASTSTKNPLYPPLAYVTPLIGKDTVNTVPPATLDHWLLLGRPQPDRILQGVEDATQTLAELSQAGIELETLAQQLLEEGLARFVESFDNLLAAIARKRQAALGLERLQLENAGSLTGPMKAVLAAATEARYLPRLWRKDPSLWTELEPVAEKITNRLGWIDSPAHMLQHCRALQRFAAGIAESGIQHVVLLGMGGSSLCPEVCAKTFGSKKGYPELLVLDNTTPRAVKDIERRIDLLRTLFIPASKSGTTIETSSFYKYFRERLLSAGVNNIGDRFVAITDPGTPLADLARTEKFRAVFENPPDIGGRFSALSFFGLVPMALIGMDVAQLLVRVVGYAADRGTVVSADVDSAVRLGVFMAECARAGRDKLTFLLSDSLASFADWAEQLVAESTGKCGVGILPVVGERIASPTLYGDDRAFVHMRLAREKEDPRIAALEKKGHPLVRILLRDPLDLGIEFFRWEVATAIAGALLQINPFDEPNVTESKDNTSRLLAQFAKEGRLPELPVHVASRGLQLTFSGAATTVVGSKISRPKDALRALVLSAAPGDYVSFLVFAPPSKRTLAKLASLRADVRAATKAATTVGFGPRYLHSTGQLHKGGPNKGIFIMVVPESAEDLPIPGEPYSFATLALAQAIGDFQALDKRTRLAVLVRSGEDVEATLAQIAEMLGFARS